MARRLLHLDAMSEPGTSGDPLVGTVVDNRYRVECLLGRGGMGRVYRAVHVGIGRGVALKVLDVRSGVGPEERQRFAREASITGKLQHPNCVGVSDFGALPDGSQYLVMELIEGVTLDDLLADVTRLPLARAARILRDVLRGLGHAHGHGLVHRDLTPRNIMLVQQDGVEIAKVLDFGLARDFSSDERLTQTGIICGTPSYMSPEQALNRPLDPRSDLYAASILLFELLTGRTPFAHDEVVKVLAGHVSGTVPALPSELAVAPSIEALIQRGLAKNPDERPPTAEAYLEALDRALAGASSGTIQELRASELVPVASRPALPALWRHPRRRAIALGAAAAVLVVGIVAAIAGGDQSAPVVTTTSSRVAAGADVEMEAETRDDPVGGAIRVAASGRGEDAIARLRALGQANPEDARIPAALGHVYARLGWPKPELDAYADALRLDPELRHQPVLIDDLVDLLESRSAWSSAARIIERELGDAAGPALQHMAEHHPDSIVRGRAARLVQRLSAN